MIAKDIYDNTLILEGSTCSYKWDNFLDLYIRVIDGKFMTGIYHKVDDFNFDVISFPFPDSNVHSSLGYKTFYSQLIRFYRLCNNKTDFLFRAKLTYHKLIARGYEYNLLRKSFLKSINLYKADIRYGVGRHENLFSQMLCFDNSVSCNINNPDIKKIITPCSVNLGINNIAKVPCCKQNKSITPLNPKSFEDNIIVGNSMEQTQNDLGTTSKFAVFQHVHLIGISNPRNHCFINAVLQYLYCILRTSDHNYDFKDNVEGHISSCLYYTAKNVSNSQDVKLKLANYDNFFSGLVQEDASEGLMLLINIMDRGIVPPSIDSYISDRDSLSEVLFSFILEKYIVCDLCALRSPSFEPTTILHVTPMDNASMQDLVLQEHKQKLYKTCSCCKKDTWHVEFKHILQPTKYLIIIVNRFSYTNNTIIKNRCPVPVDLNIMLGPYKFNLQATVDHHGHFMNSGHYTASINCCGKNFHCNDTRITECNINKRHNSSTAYIILYKLII